MKHLFISYAIEDAALARWLTLKLTIEGYHVWCFEFQMLGGESFPREIDAAIKEQTFRMLALVSRRAAAKANPLKEWTLALALGQQRSVNFLIPLNVDGIRSTELPWTLSDINWVPFHSAGWAQGLKQLLTLLEKIGAPKDLVGGAAISARAYLPDNVVSATSETLYSNALSFGPIPNTIKAYRLKRPLEPAERGRFYGEWASYRVNDELLVSLSPPATEFTIDSVESTGETWPWGTTEEIGGVRVFNILTSLLDRSVRVILQAGGARFTDKFKALYFPDGVFDKNRIYFTNIKGKRTRAATKGKSTFRRRGETTECAYYLGFRHRVLRRPDGSLSACFKIYLRITDNHGIELDPRAAQTRRKAITRAWWNDIQLNRYLALSEAIKAFQDLRRFREFPDQILLVPKLLTYESNVSLNETVFEKPLSVEEDDGAQVFAEIVPSNDGDEEPDE